MKPWLSLAKICHKCNHSAYAMLILVESEVTGAGGKMLVVQNLKLSHGGLCRSTPLPIKIYQI